ncbi:MAG: DNA-binding protein WhiA [Firmicutes bacterium]|nr:DNA-binding protein WhiA [Bacillota bacterium]
MAGELSYSARVKDEIYAFRVKNTCCRKNLLRAMLFTMKETPDPRLSRAAAYRDELMRVVYPEIPRFSYPCGDVIGEADDPKFIKCAGCRGMLLRGMFLSCGSLSDPRKKNYNLDFTFSESKFAENGKKILSLSGIAFGERRRRGSYVLYIKSSEKIADFFAAAGCNDVVYDITDERMLSDVAEAQIRTTNIEVSNMAKSADASKKACEAIRYLVDSGHISELDEKLEATAKQRLLYPELSLSQLAAISDEPITRSAVSARLSRIMSYAEKLRQGDDKNG